MIKDEKEKVNCCIPKPHTLPNAVRAYGATGGNGETTLYRRLFAVQQRGTAAAGTKDEGREKSATGGDEDRNKILDGF